eukprot:m.136489 g.136489  ORF g.136489 m.136489 type:complete len:84 (-) comp17572_c0_seq5:1244-1495(-)
MVPANTPTQSPRHTSPSHMVHTWFRANMSTNSIAHAFHGVIGPIHVSIFTKDPEQHLDGSRGTASIHNPPEKHQKDPSHIFND